MFNVPEGDNFDDASLEDELEAILSGKQPIIKRNSTNNQSKPNNQATSNKNQSNKQQQSNLHELNLNFNDLNLNDDDDNIDENDPELNAQLAAICGEELPLPAYQSNRSSNNSFAYNNGQAIHNQPNIYNQSHQNILIPTRPAPTLNEQQQNCLILNNSHFVDNQNSKVDQLIKKKDELKSLAINAKRNNDLDKAKEYLREIKDIEAQIDNLNKGTIDPTPIMKPNITRQQVSNDPHQSSASQTKTLLEALEERRQKIENNLKKEQAANNASKVRMMTRILKQFDSAIKANKLGKDFDYESLPEIHGFGELPLKNNNKPINNQLNNSNVNQQTAIQSTPKVSAHMPKKPPSKLEQLEKWKNEFKLLALDAKNNNNLDDAKIYLQKMKEVNNAIDNLNKGQQIDLSTISSPDSFKKQKTAEPTELDDEQMRKLWKVPAPASTLLEALEQRRTKFQNTLEKEQSANNVSKVKTVTRVLKQYDLAIKANKSGKEFDYESLPIPFGFSELPLSNNQQQKQPNKQSNESSSDISQPSTTASSSVAPPRPKPPMKRQISSLNNKQLEYLKQRQKLFKEAAVESNKKGDTTLALDYLRKAKGFEPLIMAVENGLPIDISNIPVPPQLGDEDFVMVSKSDEMDLTGLDMDKEEHYRKLELELEKQINMCTKNKEHFFKIGDVSTGSKFEKYLNDMKKDYELLRNYKLRNENIPKYHYENKQFSIVVCNTDVSINELTVEIMRAIDLPCKQEVDSFVKFQFDFPKETPQFGRTHSFKNSLYPEYNQNFKFQIDRKSRALARIFGKTMKFEIYSKGGLFRSDDLIGHVNVDLSPLKSRCTIFDSFPIMNGRREIGGKLQLRIKIREPLLAKQVEEIKEKWIVFDN